MMSAPRLLALALALAFAAPAAAAPRVPPDDGEVLERLPDRGAVEYQGLARLRAAAAARPDDVDAAVALADAYYRISRKEGDPRYLGYAQAALGRWWADAGAPAPALVVRATILQSAHEFQRAIADLDRAIAGDPGNARAILVRATIKTVTGSLGEARSDCVKLLGLIQDLYVLACVASVDSLTGKARESRAALEQAQGQLANATPEAAAWIASLAGEIAERLGDDAGAEAQFKASLAADPQDLYTIGAYCDWLLDRNRPADVVPLVEGKQRVDGMLLRLALAQSALGAPETAATAAILNARYDASRARGDTVHRREEARFQLKLNNDPQRALRLARDNWRVQREPADLRILAEAAKAAGDADAMAIVRQWLAATQLEDRAVAELAK